MCPLPESHSVHYYRKVFAFKFVLQIYAVEDKIRVRSSVLVVCISFRLILIIFGQYNSYQMFID